MMHLSPKGIPRPEFAPSKQSLPTEIRPSLPPESVPIVLELPPRSLPSPTTTPCEILPSIILFPRVPALKLINPSCITVVPLPK